MKNVFHILFLCWPLWVGVLIIPGSSHNCPSEVKLDAVFALDSTATMINDLPNVRNAIPRLLESFGQQFYDARFGIVYFSDEDINCVFLSNNVGVLVQQSLTSDPQILNGALNRYTATQGDYFLPEDAMGAMLVALKAPTMAWRPNAADQSRVVVVHTDAPYRYPGDRERVCDKNVRPNDGDGIYNTKEEDFPTVEQIRSALQDENVHPLFLIKKEQEQLYKDTLEKFGVGGAYAVVNSNSTDFYDIAARAIEEISCQTTKNGFSLLAGSLIGAGVGATIIGGGYYMYKKGSKEGLEASFDGESEEDAEEDYEESSEGSYEDSSEEA